MCLAGKISLPISSWYSSTSRPRSSPATAGQMLWPQSRTGRILTWWLDLEYAASCLAAHIPGTSKSSTSPEPAHCHSGWEVTFHSPKAEFLSPPAPKLLFEAEPDWAPSTRCSVAALIQGRALVSPYKERYTIPVFAESWVLLNCS